MFLTLILSSVALNTSDRSNAYILLDDYSYTIMLSDYNKPYYVTLSDTALQRQESTESIKFWMMENFSLQSYVITVCFLIGAYNVRLLDLQDSECSIFSYLHIFTFAQFYILYITILENI